MLTWGQELASPFLEFEESVSPLQVLYLRFHLVGDWSRGWGWLVVGGLHWDGGLRVGGVG